jgi:protein-disulfide isomerase
MARPISRKELLQLGGVVAVGWGAAQLFQRAAPIGVDVGDNRTAQRLLRDQDSPRADVAGADLTVVVFTDYQCPACKLAAPELDAAVRRDGRVRVIFKDWPIFGPVSEQAARVAVASARQGIYPALHHRLMAERRRLDDDILQTNVEAAGGDWARLVGDLDTHRTAIDRGLARNGADAFALGLEGTPSYLIGSTRVVGALDEGEFSRAFAQARARQR